MSDLPEEDDIEVRLPNAPGAALNSTLERLTAAPANGRWAFLHRWRLPLSLAALLVALQACGLREVLEYQRAAVLRGEVWRLLTANLVHLGWIHLSRDVAGLFLIWALLAQSLDEYWWLWVLLLSGLAVGLGLLAFSPGITWYVGISGALFGMYCAGALRQFREHSLYAGALLFGMAAVIAWTWYAGGLPGENVSLGGRVVPQAHLYGALGGAVVILARSALARRGDRNLR